MEMATTVVLGKKNSENGVMVGKKFVIHLGRINHASDCRM